jgi:hypothetical protein
MSSRREFITLIGGRGRSRRAQSNVWSKLKGKCNNTFGGRGEHATVSVNDQIETWLDEIGLGARRARRSSPEPGNSNLACKQPPRRGFGSLPPQDKPPAWRVKRRG